jgi:hypothetical protein
MDVFTASGNSVGIATQISGRAGHLPWGKTLPWIEQRGFAGIGAADDGDAFWPDDRWRPFVEDGNQNKIIAADHQIGATPVLVESLNQ